MYRRKCPSQYYRRTIGLSVLGDWSSWIIMKIGKIFFLFFFRLLIDSDCARQTYY